MSTRLHANPASAREAREFVGQALREVRAGEQDDVVVLLANELVTNAILHARGDIVLAVELAPDKVRIQVTDQSSQLPVQRGGVEEATSGRGLELVDALATAWGVEPMSGDGKQVWCEVAS
ncbi:MAG TPA: ATP-binding protein [Acidimicrobiales bacterium]|nr:ATP-binding protein [Acidimicrobiales bacterium]